MRYRRSVRWAPLLCLGLMAFFSPSIAEVSVELDSGGSGTLPSGILSIIVDEPGPWPHRWTQVRGHVDLQFLLNVAGDGRGDGEPDLVLNLAANSAEVVWAFWDGNDFEVAHSTWLESGWSAPVFLTSNEVDDLDPRLAASESGGVQVTWWRPGADPAVLFAERVGPEGGFGPETQVSEGNGSCLRPTIATIGQSTLIAYESTESNYRIVTVEMSQAGEPFTPEIIASTTRLMELDVRVHTEGQAIWAVWVDSDTHLGWSQREGAGWSSPSYEPYAGQEDIGRARLRIKGQAVH